METYIFDFDSTLTQVEGLEELATIALAGHPEALRRLEEIERLTEGAMNGSMPFAEALAKRVNLLSANARHLGPLVESLKGKLSKSVLRNADFFARHKDQILVVSSGFKEFITPVVAQLGISADRVYANTFVQDAEGNIIGYDESNPLARDQGKVALLRQLALPGHITVIGDGYTDYEMRREGLAHSFYAFTENVRRDKVVRLADGEAQSLDEFLFQHKLPGALSYPKNRIHILLLENIHRGLHN